MKTHRIQYSSNLRAKQQIAMTCNFQKHHKLYFPIYSEKRRKSILYNFQKPSFQYTLILEGDACPSTFCIQKRQNFLYYLNPVAILSFQSPYNFGKHNHLSLSGSWERQQNAVFCNYCIYNQLLLNILRVISQKYGHNL